MIKNIYDNDYDNDCDSNYDYDYDYDYNKYIDKNKDNKEFIHFDTVKECNDFIIFINNLGRNINFGNRCCNNKGCSLLNIHKKNIDILKKEFEETITENIDLCNICYEVKNLKHRCNTNKHPFCIDCLNRTNNCPICREPY
jgi:hypothetical protein